MQVTQIATILNTITEEITGETGIVQEDLTGVVDLGNTVFSSDWKDNYVKSMIDRIGKTVFVDRPYSGFAPSILRTDWEYGSILAKIRAKDFEAKENPSWSLTAGQTVDQFEYNPPEVKQGFWNQRQSWQIDCSFAEEQVKSAFTSAQEMNAFFAMIESTIDNSRTQKMDALAMRCINRLITTADGNQISSLKTDYNSVYGSNPTSILAPDFLRFTAYRILDFKDMLKVRSTLFNQGGAGYNRHTPPEDLHVVINSVIGRAIDVFLQSDTYHNDFTDIGRYETVPFWQAPNVIPSGETDPVINVEARMAIDIKDGESEISVSNIMGVLFDRDAVAMNNTNMRVTSSYNANGEYYNNFYKVDTNCMVDKSENAIVLQYE